MDIPADLDRRLELEQSRLVNENLFALDNDELHLVVGELHRGARLLVPHCQQLFDDHIALLIGHVRLRAPPPAPGPCAAHERELRRSAACGGSTGPIQQPHGGGKGFHHPPRTLHALAASSIYLKRSPGDAMGMQNQTTARSNTVECARRCACPFVCARVCCILMCMCACTKFVDAEAGSFGDERSLCALGQGRWHG